MNDDGLVSHLKCDVELGITSADDTKLDKLAAEALRKAADLVESGHIEDGFTTILDRSGKKVGEIYVDYSEGTFPDEDAAN